MRHRLKLNIIDFAVPIRRAHPELKVETNLGILLGYECGAAKTTESVVSNRDCVCTRLEPYRVRAIFSRLNPMSLPPALKNQNRFLDSAVVDISHDALYFCAWLVGRLCQRASLEHENAEKQK